MELPRNNNDESVDWFKLRDLLGEAFTAAPDNPTLLQLEPMEKDIQSKMKSFFSLKGEDKDRVFVSINPLKRTALVGLRPDPNVTIEAYSNLEKALKFGLTLKVRF